ERHRRGDGGAIGTGDNPPMSFDRVGIDLWDDEWHGWVRSKGARFSDDDGTALHGMRRELLRLGRTGREERQLHALERIRDQLLHANRLAAKADGLAGRALRRKRPQCLYGKLTLFENLQGGLPHRSGCTNN